MLFPLSNSIFPFPVFQCIFTSTLAQFAQKWYIPSLAAYLAMLNSVFILFPYGDFSLFLLILPNQYPLIKSALRAVSYYKLTSFPYSF